MSPRTQSTVQLKKTLSLTSPDLQHTIFLLTFDHKLYAAPVEKQPSRVLDAGCGTGVWSIEYGAFPSPNPTGERAQD